ncbi:unnamed protein product [Alopecurus aequalis]
METSQAAAAIEEEVGKKKMRKKTFRVPQETLDYCLSRRLGPVSRKLIERDPPAAAEMEKLKQRILAEQERMRREYEAKGYATYEAEVPDDGARYQGEITDEEDEENDAVAAAGKLAEITIDERKVEGEAEVKQAQVTVDDKKKGEDVAAEAAEVTDDSAAPLLFPLARGRRRFCPGVVKQAKGGVKKIIM